MATKIRPARPLWSLFSNSQYICLQCYTSPRIRSRTFASNAAAIAAEEEDATVNSSHEEKVNPARPPYKLASAIVLSRPPMLTRDLPEFEKAYYLYQRRLDRRLTRPFTSNLYFKKETLQEAEWKEKRKKLVNVYDPYDRETGTYDELRLGEKPGDDEDMAFEDYIKYTIVGEEYTESPVENTESAEEATKDSEGIPLPGTMSVTGEKGAIVEDQDGDEEVVKRVTERPLARMTQADTDNDIRSLNRKLSRTLYLLVKRAGRTENIWKFPQVDLNLDPNAKQKDNLRKAADRALGESCGINMHTWMIGNVPIGHYMYKYPAEYQKPADEQHLIGRAVFFMKGHILAGKPDLSECKTPLEDYRWLTKEEIEETVSKDYWKAVRHFLAER